MKSMKKGLFWFELWREMLESCVLAHDTSCFACPCWDSLEETSLALEL